MAGHLNRQCEITGCTGKHLAKGLCNKHYRAARRTPSEAPTGRPASWDSEQLEFAKQLLDDGASYHEASLSSSVPRTTLREAFPDMGWTEQAGGQFALSIMRHPHLYEMHKRIGLLATI